MALPLDLATHMPFAGNGNSSTYGGGRVQYLRFKKFLPKPPTSHKFKVIGLGWKYPAHGGPSSSFNMHHPLLSLSFVLSTLAMTAGAAPPITQPSSNTVVIGFVGGFVRQNNAIHQEVQLASHLREEYPSGLQVRMFKNHQGRQAHQAVLELLDADRNGTLSEGEKSAARVVLYGHSWGASEAVNLARTLEKDGVPVLLTIQVDSVSKGGEDDRLIPANVAQAINFYQTNGFLHGVKKILAVDRFRTQILGNFKLDYSIKKIDCAGYPWYAQLFMKPHIEIESDPAVWGQIESLIRSKVSVPVVSPR
jgi:hypothetical protein